MNDVATYIADGMPCFLCHYKSQKGFSILTHIICITTLCLESVRVYPWCYPRHLLCDTINTKCPPVIWTWVLNTHQVNWGISKLFRGLDGTNQCCVNSWTLAHYREWQLGWMACKRKQYPVLPWWFHTWWVARLFFNYYTYIIVLQSVFCKLVYT